MGIIKLFGNRPDNTGNEPARRSPKEKTNREKVRGEKAHPQSDNVNKKSGAKAGIIIASAFVVLCLAVGMLGAYANGLETIFPNVSMEGNDLSGMTMEQAANVLSKGSIGTKDDRELVVEMPADLELIISAKDAGCYLSAPDAAVFAYDACHGGSFITNTITYVKCLTGGMELTVADGAQLKEDYLREVTSEAVRRASVALMESDLDIGEESITIVKGANAVKLDKEELYEMVAEALKEGKFETIVYMPIQPQEGASAPAQELDLAELYDTVYQEPKNAEYDPELKAATEHVNGRKFDMEQAQRLWDEAQNGELVVIPLIITEPDITTDKLNDMLFADLLSQKSTSLSGSSSSRVNNITKAAASINGIILNPGEEFSYNEALGERTRAAGYQAAGAYNNGQVVQETGGGICQVSSTLYYCAMVANLEITQRTCHYFGVSYLPAGLDATVSWPSPDFKFKNDGEYPIKIEAGIDKEAYTVYVKIFGSNPEGIRVEMTTETWGTANGYGAASYRCVYDKDGNLISKKKEATSQYHYHTEEESPEPSESPEPESPSPSTEPSPSEPVKTSPAPSEPVSPSAPVETAPAETSPVPTPESVATPAPTPESVATPAPTPESAVIPSQKTEE
ncbi:MAG: VanW family protein [Oscillospiraceae bacterium]|nr:VanW family protein [Oscillospiraceae bacterium]